MKHTPGPWKISLESLTALNSDIVVVGEFAAIATLCGRIKSNNANAKLIVAAPEMLKMLKHVINHLTTESYGLRTEIEALIDKAEKN